MQCVKPITLKGIGQVPCGQCVACRLNRVRDWTIRLKHELRYHDNAVFLTLTYNDDHLPENGSLNKKDAQDWLKRLRKRLGNQKIRYFLCGEYGEKFSRPHLHVIVFSLSKDNPIFKGKKYDPKSGGYYLTHEDIWKKGIVYIGTVTTQSIRYVASYVNKKYFGKKANIYKEKGIIPEFTLMSRRPGIGEQFVNFTNPDCSNLNLSRSTVGKWLYQDITKIKSLIPKNLKKSDIGKKWSFAKAYSYYRERNLLLHLELTKPKKILNHV